jgi:RND superfamily putative drug exporter
MTVQESAGRAVATAGQAVVFAGGTVVIAMLGLAVAGVPFVTAAGVAISVIVLIMVVASITLLPAFLGLAGHRINRLGLRRNRARRGATVGSGWQHWGEHVTRNAWAYAIGAAVLLLALAAPVTALHVGIPDDGTLPETRTERRAYDLVADGFGAGINGPLVVAVDVSEDPTVVQPLLEAIEADEGIAAVAPPRCTPTQASPPWSRSRPPDRRTTRPWTRSSVSGPTCSRPRSTGAKREPTSAARRPASPTSATGSMIACRC